MSPDLDARQREANPLNVFALACATVLIASCGPPAGRESYVIRGSDTEVNLVLTLAEMFMADDQAISLAVSGGGSGTGIASLINGKTDLANSSRPLKPIEIELARDRGVEPTPFIFALDGLAVIVNAENPLRILTIDQVGALFRGEVTYWGELGGPPMEVTAYGRQSNSGTYLYFKEHVVKGDYAREVRRMNGTAQIVEAVRHDRSAVGYVGIGYVKGSGGQTADGIGILALQTAEGATAVSPMADGVITSGEYPLSRPLFQYTDGIPTGRLSAFIDFELGPEGQAVVAEQGYFPIADEHRRLNEQRMGVAR